MLCNAIHSNPEFLQIEHLDKPRQAQDASRITYHNYLTLLHTTAFQLDNRNLSMIEFLGLAVAMSAAKCD